MKLISFTILFFLFPFCTYGKDCFSFYVPSQENIFLHIPEIDNQKKIWCYFKINDQETLISRLDAEGIELRKSLLFKEDGENFFLSYEDFFGEIIIEKSSRKSDLVNPFEVTLDRPSKPQRRISPWIEPDPLKIEEFSEILRNGKIKRK